VLIFFLFFGPHSFQFSFFFNFFNFEKKTPVVRLRGPHPFTFGKPSVGQYFGHPWVTSSPSDRTKVADISDWMIKPVGPNSSSYYNSSWLVTCFKSLSLSRIATFSFHVKLVRFVGAVLHEWNTITYVCKQVSLWLPGKVALSAPMFPLAPLKVPDVTGGLNDISRGFYYVKTRYRPKMANISGWMIHPWML